LRDPLPEAFELSGRPHHPKAISTIVFGNAVLGTQNPRFFDTAVAKEAARCLKRGAPTLRAPK